MVEMMKDTHHLLDYTQVAFLITDVHSKIVYVNRYTERLFGYQREEMEGQRIRLFFLEEDLTYFLPNVVYLTLYKSGFEGEALLRQKSGNKIFVHLSTASFKEEGESFMTFSIQEIQRLKRLERERLEMERWASLGMMVEEIAHQVRNPVVSIGGYAQRLQKTASPSQKNKFYLDQIVKETKRLETIVHRVEEYVLIPTPSFQKERIEEVVEAALLPLSREATEKDISFNLLTSDLEGEGSFFTDRNLVVKSLYHVFRNSIDAFSGNPGKKKESSIKVEIFGGRENVGISVTDKGRGIPKRNLNRIFEPFFSNSPDRVGLGLTFVKRVTDELGGDILVESQLRKGTKVTLTFPRDRRRKIRRELFSS